MNFSLVPLLRARAFPSLSVTSLFREAALPDGKQEEMCTHRERRRLPLSLHLFSSILTIGIGG